MSDTPRTDEAWELAQDVGEEVAWKLCRQLERENAKLQDLIKRLDSANDAFIGHIQLMADLLSPNQKNGAVQILNLERENAALRADNERLDWLFKHGQIRWPYRDRAAIDAARKEAKP